MKKMMIIAALTVVAGMAQASSISWVFSGILAPGGSSIGTSGSGFAFTGSAADRTAIVGLLSTATWSTDFAAYQSGLVNSQTKSDASIAANSNVALGHVAITAAGTLASGGVTGGYNVSGVNTVGTSAFAGSTVQSVFAVVFDNADWTQATSYTVSVLNTQTLLATGQKTYVTTWANWDGTGVTGTWTAVVPEPTSMALLALGAAALGLRRKNRA